MTLSAACIQTHDAVLLIDFYTNVFGHTPDLIDGGVDYQFHKEQLTIFQLDNPAPETRNIALIYTVDDTDAEYARLTKLGLHAQNAPTDKPWGVRSFQLNDPAGNIVSLVQSI